MKRIIFIFITVLFVGCDSRQREEENALLFPEKHKYGFEVVYDFQYFPDVVVYLEFSCRPTKKTLKAIHAEFLKFQEEYKTVLVHELTFIEDQYAIPLNFNTIDFATYSELDMRKDIASFDFLLRNLDANPDVQDLIGVKFK